MSRLNPCASRMPGAAGSPAARTCSSVPSAATTGPGSSGGSSARCSPASGSMRRRSRRMSALVVTMPAAVPTVSPAAHAAADFQRLRGRSGMDTTVDARDACAHSAGDLVLDGSEQPCQLPGRDLVVALPAEEDDLVALVDVGVAAVHEQLVHGDHP